eukprot:scpid102254/ scgid24850/ 
MSTFLCCDRFGYIQVHRRCLDSQHSTGIPYSIATRVYSALPCDTLSDIVCNWPSQKHRSLPKTSPSMFALLDNTTELSAFFAVCKFVQMTRATRKRHIAQSKAGAGRLGADLVTSSTPISAVNRASSATCSRIVSPKTGLEPERKRCVTLLFVR